jgi:hypothetical protein
MIASIVLGLATLQGVPVGTVRTVNVASNENGTVAFRVTGNNPCGALHFIYGDGNAVTHPIVDLPTTITYRYPRSGDYAVVVQGMGNCQGEVATRVRATVPAAAAESRAESGRAGQDQPGRGRGLARGRNRAENADIRFAGMDSNRDRVITRDEWTGTPASFRVHDWNRDGVLSGAEIQMGATRPEDAVVDDPDRRGRAVPNWSRQTFDALDRDNNGRLTTNEWPYDDETFRRVDRNSDRILSPAEFQATDVDDDRDDRFEYLDMNNDGYLSGTEWHGSAATFEWLDQNRDRRLSRLEVIGEEGAAPDGRTDTFAGGATTQMRVPGNVAWRDTGIAVRAGQELRIRATGEIRWTDRAADRADPEGSLTGGFTPGAPLPQVFAGALIARVGQSAPFPVVVRDGRVRMPQSGRLFLGINDDNVSDNGGEFQVTIQVGR